VGHGEEVRGNPRPRLLAFLSSTTHLTTKGIRHPRFRHILWGAHLVPHTLPVVKFATRRTLTPNTIITGHFPKIAKLVTRNTVARQTFARQTQTMSVNLWRSRLVSQKKGEEQPYEASLPDPLTSGSHGTKTQSCNRRSTTTSPSHDNDYPGQIVFSFCHRIVFWVR